MVDTKKEQEREELHRAIWAIADELRGAVDGWDFKNYVLGTMFYRYISENLTNYINSGEQDACIAATTMMYEAEELGIHSVWLRGFDAKTVSEVFELPKNIVPVMMFAMGYPSEKAKPNAWHFKRMPLENFVTEL